MNDCLHGRYNPCFQCTIRNGHSYSTECDATCDYAYAVKTLNEKLEQAYRVIGEVVDKPNPFKED